jgi:hypothetical protein
MISLGWFLIGKTSIHFKTHGESILSLTFCGGFFKSVYWKGPHSHLKIRYEEAVYYKFDLWQDDGQYHRSTSRSILFDLPDGRTLGFGWCEPVENMVRLLKEWQQSHRI